MWCVLERHGALQPCGGAQSRTQESSVPPIHPPKVGELSLISPHRTHSHPLWIQSELHTLLPPAGLFRRECRPPCGPSQLVRGAPPPPSTALCTRPPSRAALLAFFSRDYYFGRVLSSAPRQAVAGRALLSSAGPPELARGPAALPLVQQPFLHRVTASSHGHRPTAPRLSRQVAEELWVGEAELCKGHSPVSLLLLENPASWGPHQHPQNPKPGVTSLPGFALKPKERAGPQPTDRARGNLGVCVCVCRTRASQEACINPPALQPALCPGSRTE